MLGSAIGIAPLMAAALVFTGMSSQPALAQDKKGGAARPEESTDRKLTADERYEAAKKGLRDSIERIKRKQAEIVTEYGKCPADLDKIRKLERSIEKDKELLKGDGVTSVALLDPDVLRFYREADALSGSAKRHPEDKELQERAKQASEAGHRAFLEAIRKLLQEVAIGLGETPRPDYRECEPQKDTKYAPADIFMGLGLRGVEGSTSLEERFNATGTKTFDSKPTGAALAVTGEAGYLASFAQNWFAGVAASITATRLDTTHTFANGASLGTRIDGYGTAAGQVGYWVSPQLALFVEGGAAFARQTLNVNFAPTLSKTEWVPGTVIGVGAKLRMRGSRVRFVARYNHLDFGKIEGSPPGSAFAYSGRTTINSFRAGIEFPFGN